MLGFSAAKICSVSANHLSTQKVAMDAREIAFSKAELIKAERYSMLAEEKKAKVDNTSYFAEVIIGKETACPGNNKIKRKRCTIHVYYENESIPRSTLSFNRYSASESSSVPAGTILPWYGQLANIPDGFSLCDGTNGTPDLRNRFLVGAGDAYQLGDIGGEDRVKLAATQIGSHFHYWGIEPNGQNNGFFMKVKDPLTIPSSLLPPGAGREYWNGYRYSGGYEAVSSMEVNLITSNAVAVAAQEAHENRPPYYALYYIMKLE